MSDISSETPVAAEKPPRRTFLQRLLLGITSAAGVLAALLLAIPLVGYLLGPLRKKTAPWVDLGRISDERFPVGETRLVTFANPLGQNWAGATAQSGVYVRRVGSGQETENFLVFAMNCAHLGCPVSWFPQSGLFMCPCHGGVYYENGDRASGPPPRGLFQCDRRVSAGHLHVQAPHFPTLQNPEMPDEPPPANAKKQ